MPNRSYDRWRHSRAALKAAEAKGEVADSMDVRIALVKRFEAGEMTLEQMQAELAEIKRNAKQSGKLIRADF